MFLSRNKKNNLYPCKPQFYYIKVGFKRIVYDEKKFANVVTGDETWVHYFEPVRKVSNKLWVHYENMPI